MSVNSVFLIAFGALLIGIIAVCAAFLRWNLGWASVARVTMRKAAGLHLMFILTSTLLMFLLSIVLHAASVEPSELLLDAISFAISIAVPCILIAMIYKVRLGRAAKATLPYLVMATSISLLVVLGIRYYVYEAFSIPTNSMAPTLLGVHWKAPCPRCGQLAYGSPVESQGAALPREILMTCSNEYQAVSVAAPPQERHDGDRILIYKLITPRRWDMIVFRYPEDPTVNYVMRLVGLPGERLEIRDGSVWINGESASPPGKLAGIQYSPTVEWKGETFSGAGSKPVQLGDDEYFVLGDFVEQSSDSRFWRRGAAGHPPYAVPKSHFVGVVINIYSPPSRWASFR